MILKNIRYLVTQNPERDVYENVDVLINGDEIAAIGRSIPVGDHQVLDCSEKVVMPGLVNAHTHVAMTLLRGLSDNKLLQDWLEDDIFPAEEEIGEEDAYFSALLGTLEMLKTGTTTFNDMYFHMDEVAEAVEQTGIRALLSHGIVDIEGGRDDIDEALRFVARYQDHDLIEPGMAPHAIYTASEQALLEAKDYSRIFDVPYHIHVSETKKENEDCMEETGQTPVQFLDSIGLVDQDMIAAHGVWLDREDKEIIAENDASVVHNPAANLKLGSGIADIPDLLDQGVNVAIGTDGVASNNNLNLFEEAKLAALLHKRDDPREINEQQVLDMATINGAKAIGMADRIGSIEIGKKADLITIDLEDPVMNPVHGKRGLISNLVYSFDGSVADVVVDGDLAVMNGGSVEVDERKVMKEVNERKERFS